MSSNKSTKSSRDIAKRNAEYENSSAWPSSQKAKTVETRKVLEELRKLLSKWHTAPGLIRKSFAEWTNNCEDSLEVLVSVHFPDCKHAISPSYEESSPVNFPAYIITENKIE